MEASKEAGAVLNALQQRAVDLAAVDKRNVFLTGPGGTGKSFVLAALRARLREEGLSHRVCASTGVAALGVGGCTVHSLLGTGIASRVREARRCAANSGTVEWIHRRLVGVDVVVIDEVSMLSGDYVDMMDWWLRRVMDSSSLFGGKQLVFVGDFLQLPPVEKDVVFERTFGFQADAWRAADVATVELERSYRQSDQAMVDALNRIRYGVLDDEARDLFAPCVGRGLEDPTRLCATNAAARSVNLRRLLQLQGREHHYRATATGFGKTAEANARRVVKSVIADEQLQLKVDAPVLTLVNDTLGDYVNGSRAIVLECRQASAVVRVEATGREVEVGRHTWEMLDGNGRTAATFSQLPLRLAWAMTIHKSQGMSLDRVAVDLSGVFERGQAYVALSRARSLEGLSLDVPLEPRAVFAHPEIVAFYRSSPGSTTPLV